jgi:hypothetical protein
LNCEPESKSHLTAAFETTARLRLLRKRRMLSEIGDAQQEAGRLRIAATTYRRLATK